jgi:apolipoprotein D and lipocalin family protein
MTRMTVVPRHELRRRLEVMRGRLTPLLLAASSALVVAVALVAPVGAQSSRKVEPVPEVDLERYGGRWYEIARYPNRFQTRCTGNVIVYYATRPDGRIDVRNTCDTAKGPIEAKGIARKASDEGPTSVLEVRFAPAFLSFLPQVWGDYWVLDLSPDYSTAVVGTPDHEYLWLLSRTPDVDQPTYARMVQAARSQGFNEGRLVRTPQGQ